MTKKIKIIFILVIALCMIFGVTTFGAEIPGRPAVVDPETGEELRATTRLPRRR